MNGLMTWPTMMGCGGSGIYMIFDVQTILVSFISHVKLFTFLQGLDANILNILYSSCIPGESRLRKCQHLLVIHLRFSLAAILWSSVFIRKRAKNMLVLVFKRTRAISVSVMAKPEALKRPGSHEVAVFFLESSTELQADVQGVCRHPAQLSSASRRSYRPGSCSTTR